MGYSGDGIHSCVDINECDMATIKDGISTIKCHEHANCVNNDGSYSCRCGEDWLMKS